MYQIHRGGSGTQSRGGLALNGRQIAHFKRTSGDYPLLAVLPPKGLQYIPTTVFKDKVTWVASYTWADEERVRWQAVQIQPKVEYVMPQNEAPYTMRELEWVVAHWGSEFRFLAHYRLEVTEERDRSEGRRIARALMRGNDPFKTVRHDLCIEGGLGDFLLPDCGKITRHRRDVSAPRVPFL